MSPCNVATEGNQKPAAKEWVSLFADEIVLSRLVKMKQKQFWPVRLSGIRPFWVALASHLSLIGLIQSSPVFQDFKRLK